MRPPAGVRIGKPKLSADGLTVTMEVAWPHFDDDGPLDLKPATCWRCDVVGAETDIGLCGECHDDLVGRCER